MTYDLLWLDYVVRYGCLCPYVTEIVTISHGDRLGPCDAYVKVQILAKVVMPWGGARPIVWVPFAFSTLSSKTQRYLVDKKDNEKYRGGINIAEKPAQ